MADLVFHLCAFSWFVFLLQFEQSVGEGKNPNTSITYESYFVVCSGFHNDETAKNFSNDNFCVFYRIVEG